MSTLSKEFILDTTIVVEDHEGRKFVRSGGCTAGCGACCEFMILPLHPQLLKAEKAKLDDYKLWASYHGVVVYEAPDGLMARVPIACEKLDEDKRCSVFGTDERPNMCSRTPKVPLDIEGLEDVCTYKWE